jgi:hypothetical protein
MELKNTVVEMTMKLNPPDARLKLKLMTSKKPNAFAMVICAMDDSDS